MNHGPRLAQTVITPVSRGLGSDQTCHYRDSATETRQRAWSEVTRCRYRPWRSCWVDCSRCWQVRRAMCQITLQSEARNVIRTCLKICGIAYSHAQSLRSTHIGMWLNIWWPAGEWRNVLHWIKNAALITHRMIAVIAATLFLFQTAILTTSMNIWFGKIVVCWQRHTREEQSIMRRWTWSKRRKPRNGLTIKW